MKKLYNKPVSIVGCMQVGYSLLTSSKLETGADVNSEHVVADGRESNGSFWDDVD